ncbi:MAG: right-handed parallel beta-helix repeat-containing protein [Mariprofundaceae bacterium]
MIVRTFPILLTFLLLFSPSYATAKVDNPLKKLVEKEKTTTASGEASCGQMSIKDCKNMALEEAKRNAVEKGSAILIDSTTEMKDFQISSDEIRSRVRAIILRYDVLDKGFVGDSGYFYKIRAVVKGQLIEDFNKPSSRPKQTSHPTNIQKTQWSKETLTVAPSGKGDFTTIGAAIKAAKPGSRIRIKPGRYMESLVIDKELHLENGGHDTDEVIVTSRSASTLKFAAEKGSIRGLIFKNSGKGDKPCIDIGRGKLQLSNNDISSRTGAGIAIRFGADPVISENKIHDTKTSGVHIFDKGLGRIDNNDIFNNNETGLLITTNANPAVMNNRVHNNSTGIIVTEQGKGNFESNDIYDNKGAGIEISEGATPTFIGNRIHHGQMGVVVQNDGFGYFEDNEIYGHAYAGISVGQGGDPVIIGNRIYDNQFGQIIKRSGSKGKYEDNNNSP